MVEVIRHWIVVLVGMTLTGLVCVMALPLALSTRGGVGPTIFQAESPLIATAATTVAMAIAFVISVVVGRMLNTAVGLFVMGWGIAVFAMRTENVQDLALAGAPNMVLIALETLIWAIGLLILCLLMFKLSGPFKDVHPRPFEDPPNPFTSPDAIKLMLPALLVLPAVMLIAQSPMKGQVLTAVFLGSVLAGLLGRLVSPHVQPVLLFAMPCAIGAVGHVIGMIQLRGPIDEAFVAHAIPALSLPMPVDYAAGSLMGVAFGLGWAKSFLHHEEESGEEAAVNGASTA